MCVRPQPGEKLVPVRCQPKTFPCPTCGRHGHRKRRLDRFVRSLAYGQVLWLHVFYAEYTARCDCRKSFRSCPANICPKVGYDNLVRQAVLNRILDDRLNVQRTRAAMKRDFLLELSSGFIYDCLNGGLARLSQTEQRRHALKHFGGFVCVDELHLGDYTLLLATDPLSDRVIGYRLVLVNDQAHMRCFLRTLQYWGFEPKVVVTDGSNLYPAVLAQVWPAATRQLWHFCFEVYRLFSPEQVLRLARRRRTLLLKKASYQEVPELVKAMGLLRGEKFDKMVAFLGSSEGARVRTNNHVERANRKLRYDEKVRYKFRSRHSLDRFLRLRLDLLGRQASSGRPLPANAASNPKADPSSAPNSGGD